MILTRPTYLAAPTLESWVQLNRDLLARYWMACDEALKDFGVAAPLDEWDWFCRAQYDSWQKDHIPEGELQVMEHLTEKERQSFWQTWWRLQ